MIRDHLLRSRDALHALVADPAIDSTIEAIANRVYVALRRGNKVMFIGNGGSAADAQHLAGELTGRYLRDRDAFAAIALTDGATLTALGNDYGFKSVFARQVLGIGQLNDVLIALSTSGRSPNVLQALRAARAINVLTVGFTGSDGGDMPPLCDLCLRVPSDETPIIQQLHLTVGHAICGLVETYMTAGIK